MSRIIVALAACLAAVLGVVGLAAPSANAYPPQTCSTVSVSTTEPATNATIVVSGKNFQAGITVTVELHTTVFQLGSTTVQSDGTFSLSVTLPDGVTGQHDIVVTGGDPNCPNSVPIDIGKGVGPTPPPSNTGVDVALLLLVGLGLVAVGLVINDRASARRRRHRHSAA
jgi:hypothetical protein